MKLLTYLLRKWQVYKRAKELLRDELERVRIAKAFNDRYTFRKLWKTDVERLPGTAYGGLQPRGGNAWMCPDCNQIHLPTSCSVFSGLQYPACCKTGEGHRLLLNIKQSD